MPPAENKNNLGYFRVNIDPVFKSNQNQNKNFVGQNVANLANQNPGQGGAYNVLNNQKYVPAQPATPIPVLSKEPEKGSLASNKSVIRTYKGDLESAIAADHLSSINIAIAENQKMHEQIRAEENKGEVSPTVPSDYSKNKIIIFVSLLLIILGFAGLGVVFLFKTQGVSPTAFVQELPALITAEYKAELNVSTTTKEKFIMNLSAKLNESSIPANNFYNIYLTTGTSTGRRLISASEFVTLADFKMPDIVKRTLLADFMVGTYSYDKNLPFIIFKTSSFDNTYAGMLAWEKDLPKDFLILFRFAGYETAGSVLTNLTPGDTFGLFEDKVINNKDVRLLRDKSGQIILLYGIVDKETIVITVNDTAFKEILNRLNKEKTLKR